MKLLMIGYTEIVLIVVLVLLLGKFDVFGPREVVSG